MANMLFAGKKSSYKMLLSCYKIPYIPVLRLSCLGWLECFIRIQEDKNIYLWKIHHLLIHRFKKLNNSSQLKIGSRFIHWYIQ